MSERKAGGVEIYDACEYLQSRHLWGTGKEGAAID